MVETFKCFFCSNPATSVAYYSKSYPDGSTLENPTFCCNICFDSPRIINQINPVRGGDEGVYRFLFSTIGKWTPKQIGYYCSQKAYQINHLSSRYWRKLIFRIHYIFQPIKSIGVVNDNSKGFIRERNV